MTTSALFHRLAVRTTVLALAVSCSVLVPAVTVQAQAPAAPQPLTSGDAKEYMAAEELFNAQKWPEAMQAFEKFRNKYKMLSPFSVDAHFRLGVAYLQQQKPLHAEAVAVFRALIANQKVDPAIKEQAQLLIAKAITMQGASMPGETDVQKGAQAKIFEQAIAEYTTYLTQYPNSRSGDAAHFLRGSLALAIEKFDDAVKDFGTVYQRYAQSPLRMQALMNIGKTFMARGYAMITPKGGKEPGEPEVKQALDVFEKNALPSLNEAYRQSGDLAIMNEAIYYVGQIQLTRSQNAPAPEEGARLLNFSLEAFRAVRSREEVIKAQEEKIAGYTRAIQLLRPGTPEYMPSKNYYENIIGLEEEKKKKFLDEQDQFLGARLAIARIFLFLKKPDECRALLRYLQGQKELLEKEKDAQATIASLLALTYIEQKNTEKALETYQAYRAAFKGNLEGDNLPLLVANLLLEKGDVDKAEAVVGEGSQDYGGREGGWRFQVEANQILIGAAIQKSNWKKAMELADSVLSTNPKPAVEVQTLFLKATIQRAEASEGGKPDLADQAVQTFQTLRDKFPGDPKAEEAWFEQCSILASRDPVKALPELQKFLQQFASGGGKSENTAKNVPVAQFRLAQVLEVTGKEDEAIKAYTEVYTKWPESDPAPGAFFKMFDIYNRRKDFANCVKLMEEFIQKYPEHENVYYAYNNIAEFLFAASLREGKSPDGKPVPKQPTIEDLEAGAKKLHDYVDYELSKDIKVKRGDAALSKIADRWVREMSKLPSYVIMNNDQKITWQKAVEGVTAAVEKLLKSYPQGEKVGEALERLVTVQTAMVKASVSDAAKGDAYFRKLTEGVSDDLKAKILFALSAFHQELDPKNLKKAAGIREEAIALAPANAPADKADKQVPTFTPADWDRYLADLFEARKFEDMAGVMARVKKEYPLEEGADPTTATLAVQNAQSTALYWEAKVLGEQGKGVEAGNLFTKLAKDFPKSTKVLEADYGIIFGLTRQGKWEDETFLPRLQKIVTSVRDVKSFELPAKALFLIGEIERERKEYEAAIATFRKIHTRYESVPLIAGDGLWEAGQLLEKQASGAIPVRTPKELQAAAQARAEKMKAQKAKEEAEKKKAEEKDKPKADPKATDAQPADAKKPEVAAAPAANK
jgi:TolA-binding protein